MFDGKFFFDTLVGLLPYILDALEILVFSILYGALFGALLAKAKLGRARVPKVLADGYTTFIRCTPSIVLLYVIFYGLPNVFAAFGLTGDVLERRQYIIITFALYCAGSLSEVFRSAYAAVDSGQREAGISIGMTEFTVFRHIILPQMICTILPPLGNTIIAVLNEGSLGFAIGYLDVLGHAKLIGQKSYGMKNVEIYVAAAIVYWVCSIIIGRIIHFAEKRFSRYQTAN